MSCKTVLDERIEELFGSNGSRYLIGLSGMSRLRGDAVAIAVATDSRVATATANVTHG